MWATPNSLGGLDDRLGPAGMEAFQRADRTEHDRQPQLASEHFGRRIDLAHVAQHARPERDGVERHAVSSQRRLGLDAADDVVPIVLVQVLPGPGDNLVQVQEFVSVRRSAQECGLVGILAGHGSTLWSGMAAPTKAFLF